MVTGRKNKFGKPYITETKPGHYYIRKNGKYLGAITAPPGTQEFDRQYWQILNGKAAVKTSLSQLIAQYRSSDRWIHLKPATKATYKIALDYIEEKNGDKDATRIRRKDVVKARDANKDRPTLRDSLSASCLCSSPAIFAEPVAGGCLMAGRRA